MNDKIEWVMVPREADDAMEAAAEDYYEGSGTPFPDWKAAYAAMLAAAPKPEAQAADYSDSPTSREAAARILLADGWKWEANKWQQPAGTSDQSRFNTWAKNAGLITESSGLRFVNAQCDTARLAWQAALSTPASHGAQQDTSPEYRRGWLAGVESMRQELAQQPAVVGDDGFRRAFYEIADVLEIGARPYSPEIAFQRDMLPRIRELAELAKGQEYQHSVAGDEVVWRVARALWASRRNTLVGVGQDPERAWNKHKACLYIDAQHAIAALTPAATPGEGTVSASDWRDLYRLQTAMRYMDCDAGLTRETAYSMADADIGRIEAPAQKEGNGNG